MLKAGEWAVLIVEGQPLNARRGVSGAIDEVETDSVFGRVREKVTQPRRGDHLDSDDL